MSRVAVITGANTGIGYSVAKLLAQELEKEERSGGRGAGGDVFVCLACRNPQKAAEAKQQLRAECPRAFIEVVQVDTSSTESCVQAAKEIQKKYTHVDWFFCNAGILPVSGVDWGTLWPPRPRNLIHSFSTGGDLLKLSDGVTPEGLRQVFATNVFGHFIMIKELEPFLASQGRPCHIIWTSSSSAARAEVDAGDIQAKRVKDPYAYSKRTIDLISRQLNTKLNHKGIYSDTACPGLVMTSLTYGILPKWLWALLFPILVLIRMCLTKNVTLSPDTGSKALVWLARQDPARLDHSVKYESRVTALGTAYVDKSVITGSEELSSSIFEELWGMADEYTHSKQTTATT